MNTENFNLRNGDKKKLGKKDQQRYDGKRASLLKSLNNISDQCKKFLEAAGLSVNDVLNAVKLQRPFDGETYTISRGAAGTIDESEWEPGATEGFKQRQRDQTEASYFKHVRFTSAETGNYPGGKLGVSPADRSNVYFRPARGPFGIYSEDSGLKESIILHEALHSLTGLSDRKLLKLLTNEEVSTSSEASRKITSALKEHDCID